jgi:hypothetical protein
VQRAWEGENTAVYPIVTMYECEVSGWELWRWYAVMLELPRSGDDPAASLEHDAHLHVANHGNGLGVPMSNTFQQVRRTITIAGLIVIRFKVYIALFKFDCAEANRQTVASRRK